MANNNWYVLQCNDEFINNNKIRNIKCHYIQCKEEILKQYDLKYQNIDIVIEKRLKNNALLNSKWLEYEQIIEKLQNQKKKLLQKVSNLTIENVKLMKTTKNEDEFTIYFDANVCIHLYLHKQSQS